MRPCADPGRSQRLQKRGSDSDSGRMLSHRSVEELVGRGLEEFPCPTFVEEGDHGGEEGCGGFCCCLGGTGCFRAEEHICCGTGLKYFCC